MNISDVRPATAGEGTQNILCAYLSLAILVGLGANALFGLWWADPAVALIVALVAIQADLQTWRGQRLLRRLLNRHCGAVTERGACPRLVGTTVVARFANRQHRAGTRRGTSDRAHAGTRGHGRRVAKRRFAGKTRLRVSARARKYRP